MTLATFSSYWKNKNETEKGKMMVDNNYFLDNDYGKNKKDIIANAKKSENNEIKKKIIK